MTDVMNLLRVCVIEARVLLDEQYYSAATCATYETVLSSCQSHRPEVVEGLYCLVREVISGDVGALGRLVEQRQRRYPLDSGSPAGEFLDACFAADRAEAHKIVCDAVERVKGILQDYNDIACALLVSDVVVILASV